MKKISRITIALLALLSMLPLATSCLNEYLDRSPESGLSEEEVFTKYANFKSFFYAVYTGSNSKIRAYHPLTFAFNNKKFTFEGLTDMCDMARLTDSQKIKQGDGEAAKWIVGYNTGVSGKEAAKVTYAWKIIRICNIAIQKIDMLQDATNEQKEDLLAQAYFIRAYVNFEIFRFYGAIPYVDKVLGADDEWDLPACDENEFLHKVADDFQTAADHFKAAGLMRRDPASGAGHLAATDQDKPNGVAAYAMKGRALLYAASPLNNPTGDKARWEEAAEANAEAIDIALEYGFELLPLNEYTQNFNGTNYSNEQLWAYSPGSFQFKDSKLQAFVGYVFSQDAYSSAQCPTQNFVDKFETKAEGYALNTDEDRKIATEAGAYNEQNPFVNRDPRFDYTIVYNQKDLSAGGYGMASLYILPDGSLPSGSLLQKKSGSSDGVTETYYYECKRMGGPYQKTQTITLTDPIIRLGELYLNYAEAAFEAYGSPDGKCPDASMTSLEALNTIRARVGMPEVREEYLSDNDVYRSRIKNERTVELCFEGYHYYCDIRRWKDAPAIGQSTLYGMRAQKLAAGEDATNYPTGFKYTRIELPANRQITWKNDGMYYIQFQNSDIIKMKNYTPHMAW